MRTTLPTRAAGRLRKLSWSSLSGHTARSFLFDPGLVLSDNQGVSAAAQALQVGTSCGNAARRRYRASGRSPASHACPDMPRHADSTRESPGAASPSKRHALDGSVRTRRPCESAWHRPWRSSRPMRAKNLPERRSAVQSGRAR